MQRAMSAVPVQLRAEVASIELPVRDILALTPGSVVKFGVPAEHGVALFAENVKLARAQPGSHGPRRAVQICGGEGRR
jgi:flagellar motor switch protein FliM